MTTAFALPVVPLEGRFVRLEPFTDALKPEVRAALDGDTEAWALTLTAGHGPHFDGWWGKSKDRAAYAVRRLPDGAVVGATSFYDLRAEHRGVAVGHTHLHAGGRGSAINPEMKRLMLGHAFDAGAVRVEIVTDARNLRSQAAIVKLGAVREGVLRRHKVTWSGHLRDTVVFAITDLDWPAVRARLDARLAAQVGAT